MAGVLGLDPGRLTLRELVWMTEGRQRDQWAHTSTLLALVANVNRDPKKTRAFRPDDFNPFVPPKPRVKAGIDILKQVFVERGRCPVPAE